MNYRGLFFTLIGFDVIYSIYFFIVILLDIMAQGMSNNSHSHTEEAKLYRGERTWIFKIYIIAFIGTLLGFITLVNLTVYLYYQMLLKLIIFTLFVILFLKFTIKTFENDWVYITYIAFEGAYGIIAALHVVEFVFNA